MALKREMKISIGPDGNVQIEVNGVPGSDCLDFTRFIEEELGEVLEREHTAEFYSETETEEHVEVGSEGAGE